MVDFANSNGGLVGDGSAEGGAPAEERPDRRRFTIEGVEFFADDDALSTGHAQIFDGRIVMLRVGADSVSVQGFVVDNPPEKFGYATAPEVEDMSAAAPLALSPVLNLPSEDDIIGADAASIPRVDFRNTRTIEAGDITDLGFPTIRIGLKIRGVVVGRAKVPGQFGEEEIVMGPDGPIIDPRTHQPLKQIIQEVFLVRGTVQIEIMDERLRRPRLVEQYGTMMIRCYQRLEGPLGTLLRRQDEETNALRRVAPNAARKWYPVEIECIGRGRDKEGTDGVKSRSGAAYFAVRHLGAPK